jgi:hypothetical protein
MDFDKEFLSRLLKKATLRKSPARAREFYWDCIKNLGYSNQPVFTDYSEIEESEDPYAVFKQMESGTQDTLPMNREYYSPPVLGVAESQQMSISDQYGFNRTFIGPLESSFTTSSGNRLSEINKWINVSNEETELKKVIEIIDQVLNGLRLSELLNIRRLSINMYWNIMQYYKTNSLGLTINKGSLKLGYITMVIYYSLVYFKRNVTTESIVRFIPDASISYLPRAKKNIMLIFRESPNYSFILGTNSDFSENSGTCNKIIEMFPPNVQRIINKVKNDLSENIQRPLSNVQIAACIYFVTSVPLSKGGIFQTRLKVIDGNNSEIKITTGLLMDRCGNFAPATLTKNVNAIITFYKNNPDLKNELV